MQIITQIERRVCASAPKAEQRDKCIALTIYARITYTGRPSPDPVRDATPGYGSCARMAA